MSFGVDYAWGRPSVTALHNAGVVFVCRYLSHDTTGKNLDHAEAVRLSNAGIWLVTVWETTAKRALAGRAAGIQDAKDADQQAKACGQPAGRPIYFATDWDVQRSELAAVNAYLDGVASVIGRGRTGIYGGYRAVKAALDGGHCAWAWQTYAWSGGRWDPRAQIQQYSNDHTIGGVGLDYDRSTHSDYGQWKVGVTPPAGEGADVDLKDQVPLTYKDATGKQVRLWAGKLLDKDSSSVEYLLACAGASLYYSSQSLLPQLQAANAAITELTKTVAALAANSADLDPDALIAKIKTAIENVTVHLDVPDPSPADG
jgi:Domain of unknown function (DUF1906)